MSEQSMSKVLMEALRPLHPLRVENRACMGTPDVNYTGGWIELKELPSWPTGEWKVRIPHFTVEQKLWLRSRCRAGGKAYLLLKVGSEWLLFDGQIAGEVIGETTAHELRGRSCFRWFTKEKHRWAELLEYLK